MISIILCFTADKANHAPHAPHAPHALQAQHVRAPVVVSPIPQPRQRFHCVRRRSDRGAPLVPVVSNVPAKRWVITTVPPRAVTGFAHADHQRAARRTRQQVLLRETVDMSATIHVRSCPMLCSGHITVIGCHACRHACTDSSKIRDKGKSECWRTNVWGNGVNGRSSTVKHGYQQL